MNSTDSEAKTADSGRSDPDRTRVYVVFGGRSGEHKGSVTSALAILQAFDRTRYDVVPIGVRRDGRWLLLEDTKGLAASGGVVTDGIPLEESGDPLARRLLPPQGLWDAARASSGSESWTDGPPAVVFPILPGPYGEDGSIQGAFEMAGVPYVGAGVLSSAVGMDKAAAKALLLHAGLPVVPFHLVRRSAWERAPHSIVEIVEKDFDYPVFVKPANAGSSLGINKVWNRDGLKAAVGEAAEWDRRILVERAVDAREIEVAVLGNEDPVVSIPAEVVPGAEFYTHRDKHIDDKAKEIIPAPLTSEQTEEAQELALAVFRALDCCGMARVDLLLDRNSNRFWASEINTAPGLRRTSTYPRALEAVGYTYSQILDRLVELALERWADRRRNRTRAPDFV